MYLHNMRYQGSHMTCREGIYVHKRWPETPLISFPTWPGKPGIDFFLLCIVLIREKYYTLPLYSWKKLVGTERLQGRGRRTFLVIYKIY